MRSTPMGAMLSMTYSIIGLPATGRSGLGCVNVSGYNRVAYPAARIRTFIVYRRPSLNSLRLSFEKTGRNSLHERLRLGTDIRWRLALQCEIGQLLRFGNLDAPNQ